MRCDSNKMKSFMMNLFFLISKNKKKSEVFNPDVA